jgi:hypothetical protein
MDAGGVRFGTDAYRLRAVDGSFESSEVLADEFDQHFFGFEQLPFRSLRRRIQTYNKSCGERTARTGKRATERGVCVR